MGQKGQELVSRYSIERGLNRLEEMYSGLLDNVNTKS